MRIALFKNIEFGYTSVYEDIMDDFEGYIRVSEYMDVEFPPLKDEDVVASHVSALESAKKEVQADAQRKLTELDRQIGELLSLTVDD